MKKLAALCIASTALFFASCTTHFASFGEQQREKDLAFEQVRAELADLKHALHGQRVEMQILEERLQEQEGIAQEALKPKPVGEALKQQMASLERKLMILEKSQEKILADLQNLGRHADHVGHSLAGCQNKIDDCQKQLFVHADRLDDIKHLKSTLTNVSKAISQKAPTIVPSVSTYRVKAKDTLEKIAKFHGVSVEQLKRLNQIQQDRIFIGQELKIADNIDP